MLICVCICIEESSQDEAEEVKAVNVKFARQETDEQKSRRMQSYDYMKKKQDEESWCDCTYHKTQVSVEAMLDYVFTYLYVVY